MSSQSLSTGYSLNAPVQKCRQLRRNLCKSVWGCWPEYKKMLFKKGLVPRTLSWTSCQMQIEEWSDDGWISDYSQLFGFQLHPLVFDLFCLESAHYSYRISVIVHLPFSNASIILCRDHKARGHGIYQYQTWSREQALIPVKPMAARLYEA
jgi:hypothetical protein